MMFSFFLVNAKGQGKESSKYECPSFCRTLLITEVENVNLFLATNKMAAKSQSKVSGKSSKTPLSTNNTSKTDPKGKKSVTIADVRRERVLFF